MLDEVERGVVVEVLSCDDAWCRVQFGGTFGYLEKAVLIVAGSMPDKPAGQPANEPACFESRRAGYGKGELLRYCPQPAR